MQQNCVECGKKPFADAKALGKKACGKAVISPAYGPHHFCREHFLHFFEKRVRRTIRENRLVEGREKIVVAYSGGKDSGTALFILKKIFGKSNPIEALLIDEGIPNYRGDSLDVAEKNCRQWGIPFRRVSFKEEYGFTMAEAMKKKGREKPVGSSCAYCGVLRRQLLNKHAKKMGAGKIATGHNLDDEAQSVLMNVFDADIARFFRLGPKSPITKGMVPRIKPLYLCPEKEVEAFAKFSGIGFFKKGGCPFKWQAKRNDFRQMVEGFEEKYPGTMFSIVQFLKQAKEGGKKNAGSKRLSVCPKCGEPSSGGACKACKMVEGLGGKVN